MAVLMRCHTAHFQGNKMIPEGTVRPAGHKEVIPIYFEPFETDEPAPPEPAKTAEKGKSTPSAKSEAES